MDRRLLSMAFTMLVAGVITQAQAAAIKIETGPQGVLVEAGGVQCRASRLSYDETKGILMLEGTQDAPATLFRKRNGKAETVSALKIMYSLKESAVRAESAGSILLTQ